MVSTNIRYGYDWRMDCLAIDGYEFTEYMNENTNAERFVVDRFADEVGTYIGNLVTNNELLEDENWNLKAEIQKLRARLEDMGVSS